MSTCNCIVNNHNEYCNKIIFSEKVQMILLESLEDTGTSSYYKIEDNSLVTCHSRLTQAYTELH